MRTAICAALGWGFASVAFAGDQPVIFVPTMPPVFKDGGGVIYFMASTGVGAGIDRAIGGDGHPSLTATNTHSVTGAEAVTAAGSAALRSAATDTGGAVRATELPVGATSDDALYSALLKEARARGLR